MKNHATEVGFADGGGNHGIQDIADQRVDDGIEGCAQNHGDREVNNVSTKYKVTKSLQHVLLPHVCSCKPCGSKSQGPSDTACVYRHATRIENFGNRIIDTGDGDNGWDDQG